MTWGKMLRKIDTVYTKRYNILKGLLICLTSDDSANKGTESIWENSR